MTVLNSIVPQTQLALVRKSNPTPQTHRRPEANPVPMRRYDIAYLDSDGSAQHRQIVAPATPVFECGFSAFARGTVIKTSTGPCAVEDLMVGEDILTEEFGALPLTWRGGMTLIPNAPAIDPETQRLTRVISDTFGVGRPASDLLLGPGARLTRRAPSGQLRLVDATELADGESIVRTTPPTPVQVYHICLPMQATISANGIGVASFHPGLTLSQTLGPNMLKLFMSLFPQATTVSDFGAQLSPPKEPAPSYADELDFA